MIRNLLPLALLAASTVALTQNAPPTAGAAPAADGHEGGMRAMMSPADRFKQLDKNGDGKLSMEEFSAMQMRMGGGPGGPPPAGAPAAGTPPAQGGAMSGGPMGGMMSAADRFKAMDTNHDGSISLEEFTAAIKMRMGGGGGPRPAGGS